MTEERTFKNDFTAIMRLIILLWPIIEKWLDGETEEKEAAEEISTILQISDSTVSEEDADDTSYCILNEFASNAPGGIIEEIGKIGQIFDAIVKLLEELFGKKE